LFSAAVRDLWRGCVWEEDGKIVGATIVQRHGSTNIWVVGTVAVLPAYRRRGIARQLVERGIEIIRAESGERVWLSVIDGNLPAHALYEDLGFEHYSGQVDFVVVPDEIPPLPDLPEGYFQADLGNFEWQPRFELEKSITPQAMRKYEPVEEGRFRDPFVMRLIYPLVMLAQGTRQGGFMLGSTENGHVLARGEYTVPRGKKGLNVLRARLDPGHAELATYLIGYLLNRVATMHPGLRVEMVIPLWMEALIAAAEETGFQRRMTYHKMGMLL